jgi:hypothetical protein
MAPDLTHGTPGLSAGVPMILMQDGRERSPPHKRNGRPTLGGAGGHKLQGDFARCSQRVAG